MNDFVTIQINNVDFKLKRSYGGMMLFEKMTSQNVTTMKEDITNTLTLFYCFLKACNKDTFTYSFEEFIDILDDNEMIVDKFSKYLISISQPTNEKKNKVKL